MGNHKPQQSQQCKYGSSSSSFLDSAADGQHSSPELDDFVDCLDLVSPVQDDKNLQICEQFHMDFGFAHGKLQSLEKLQLFTSVDVYCAYLLIIDHKRQYIWTNLTKTKHSPIQFLTIFFEIYGLKTGCHVVCTDKGGELWGSFEFHKLVDNAGYLLEPTAPDAPFQNGMAERPEQTLGIKMCCMLHAAALGPEFWSFALVHAVWIYNMLPHSVTGQSPYFALTGKCPSIANLHIRGCRVFAKKKGPRPHKLDDHTSTGIYLGHTATDKIIYYYDLQTKWIKTTTHAVYDDANYTVSSDQ
jgi:hypothetical protein